MEKRLLLEVLPAQDKTSAEQFEGTERELSCDHGPKVHSVLV